MKYRELIEGQSDISSFFTLNLLQLNNDDYQKVMTFVINKKEEEISEEMLAKIRKLPYP